MYLTLRQLAEKPGALELSQVASSEHGDLVDPSLLDTLLRGGDTSSFAAEAIASGQAAIQRIQSSIDETTNLIDAHLARRVTVPRDPVPQVLVSIARAIVRYELHKHLIASEGTHPVVRDYRDKLRLLEAIRDGRVMLGTEDPASAGRADRDDIRIESDPRVFGRNQMRHFR